MTSFLLPLALLAMQSQADREVLKKLGITVVEPMNERATAKVRAQVDAALAKAGAGTAFENVTTHTGGMVRHRTSGLACPLGKKGQEVAVEPDDAALCRTRNGDVLYETRVSRAPVGATLTSVHDAALRDAQAEPGFAPSGLNVVVRPKPGSGRTEHRTIAYTSRIGGKQTSTRLLLGLFDGWLLTERIERSPARAGGPSMTDLLSETLFGSKLKPTS